MSLTKTDAAGYAKDGIRVSSKNAPSLQESAEQVLQINCICPGVVLTPMNASSRLAGDNFSYLDTVPSQRAAQPEEIAWAALFLSHPNSDYCVGSAVLVDGGMSIV